MTLLSCHVQRRVAVLQFNVTHDNTELNTEINELYIVTQSKSIYTG